MGEMDMYFYKNDPEVNRSAFDSRMKRLGIGKR